MSATNQSEYLVPPQFIIVHDPTEFGAFDGFTAAVDENALLATYLFRAQPDVDALRRQHQAFVETIRQYVPVRYLKDVLEGPGLDAVRCHLTANANHVFTHDAFITLPWVPDGYFLANMKKTIRQKEPAVMQRVAETLGLQEIVRIPPGLYLEGGDVMPICLDGKRMLLIGYGPRTSADALRFLDTTLVRAGIVDEILGFQLAEWRLNIDGCFFPVSDRLAVANRESIRGGMRLCGKSCVEVDPVAFFESHGYTIVEATRVESFFLQACNYLCLGSGRFIAYNMTDRINALLRDRGLTVIGVGGDQLVKGNGGPHCITRPIYRAP